VSVAKRVVVPPIGLQAWQPARGYLEHPVSYLGPSGGRRAVLDAVEAHLRRVSSLRADHPRLALRMNNLRGWAGCGLEARRCRSSPQPRRSVRARSVHAP
jgi:hypothetical protein